MFNRLIIEWNCVLLLVCAGVEASGERAGARDGKTGQRKNLGSTEARVSQERTSRQMGSHRFQQAVAGLAARCGY